MGKENDRLVKTAVVSLVTFLILEAFLPKEYRYLAFLYLVLLETLLWVGGIVEKGLGNIDTTARMLGAYIALSALLVDTESGDGQEQSPS